MTAMSRLESTYTRGITSDRMAQRYLITGSSGFIGSNISNYFEGNGHEVVRMDLIGDADIISDLRETDWEDVDLSGFAGVIHLAAKISVPESFEKPREYEEVNVRSTRRLFESCVRAGVPRVVFASSAAVYGEVVGGVMKVGREGSPLSPYAKSKMAGEKLAEEVSTQETKITCFRFFNVYGYGQSPKGQYASVIPLFLEKIIKSEQINIFGNGEQTRDFIHVDDISETILTAFSTNLPPFSVYNLGSGSSVSINQLVSTMSDIFAGFGINVPPPSYSMARNGDIENSVADMQETREKFPDGVKISLKEGLLNQIGRTIHSSDALQKT